MKRFLLFALVFVVACDDGGTDPGETPPADLAVDARSGGALDRGIDPEADLSVDPDATPDPDEGLIATDDGVEDPDEGSIALDDGVEDPDEGSIALDDGVQDPDEGSIALDDGVVDPDEGSIAADDGVQDPDEGSIAADDGVEDPDEGSITPDRGVQDPDEGFIAPDRGVLDPDEGPIEPDMDPPPPDEGVIAPDLGALGVEIEQPIDGAELDVTPIDVVGRVTLPAAVTVGGVAVAPDDEGRFTARVELAPGPNEIVAVATRGEARAEARVTVRYTALDVQPPMVDIRVPAADARLIRDRVDVSGILDEPATVRVEVGAAQVEATVDGLRWVAAAVPLPQGEATIEAIATDPAGNVGRDAITITVDSVPPLVEITEPADALQTGDATVTVRGRVVADDVERVEVDGVEVPLDGAGRFERVGVELQDGRTVITVAATDAFGNVGQARVAVLRDATPPTIHIETPAAGAVLTTTQVDVAGICNDFITGITINADDLQVWVNGVEATVLNRTFTVSDLLLQRGRNTITVEAEDRAGNRSSRQIEVTVADEVGQRLVLISGQSQGTRTGAPLRDPLVVSLLDARGGPVPERPVTFTVSRGDGTLQAFPAEGRELVIETDDNGLAAVGFVPGSRTGAGSHRVVARADGFLGEVEFCTSVYPADGAQVLAVTGENQMGRVGTPLAEPFTALVTDARGNPVGGAEVVFTVEAGGGGLIAGEAPAAEQVTVTSNEDGLVLATLVLGEAGRNSVTASLVGRADEDELAAAFHAEAVEAGARASTRVVGQVLDNQDNPLPGATAWIRLEDGPVISAVADAQGRFVIEGAPVGAVHLVIEGETVERAGAWPRLTYDLVTVAGADNGVGTPIYLPELDPTSAGVVGGPDDVTLRLAGIEGASLTIWGGSATCLDGRETCEMMWSQVRGERVPDPAPMGSSFDLVATLQPPGVRFDPPARLCIPNRGNPPGFQMEMFGYDHDLGDWVGLGTGTVTPDGASICSDTGFGLHKSGWHGAPPPPPPPTCTSSCDDGNKCTRDFCKDGNCKHEPTNQGGKCDDGSGCGEATCNDSGACVFQSQQANDTPCDDGSACTENDVCKGGACSGERIDCNDDEQCTTDTCDDATGCKNERAVGQGCDDKDPCTENDVCTADSCAGTDKECTQDDDVCTEHACNPDTGSCDPEPTNVGGECGADDDNPCDAGQCNADGECDQEPVREGEACREGDDEQCGWVCTDGDCAPGEGARAEGAECDDEDACTEDDVCTEGKCEGEEVDLETLTASNVFAADIVMPANAVERINGFFARIPGLNRIRFNKLTANFSEQSKNCCNEDTGFEELGVTDARVTVTLSAETKDIPLFPGYASLQFDRTFDLGVAEVDLLFQIGLFMQGSINFAGQGGGRKDACEDEYCGFFNINPNLNLALKVLFEGILCFDQAIFISVNEWCRGVTFQPFGVNISVGGQFSYNLNTCDDGLDVCGYVGKVDIVATLSLDVPGGNSLQFSRTVWGGFGNC